MDKQRALLDTVVALASQTLEVDAIELSTNVNIQELGFNSVSLVSFVEKVSSALDDDVHPGVFFEHSTLDAFTAYLLEHKADAVDKHLSQAAPGDIWNSVQAEMSAGAAQPYVAAQPMRSAPAEKMPKGPIPQDVPVIIGGGIGGMLISRALSRKKIRHVLIGSSQLGDTPKLGESMTVNCGTWVAAACDPTMNRLRAKRLCQAYSVMTRIGSW